MGLGKILTMLSTIVHSRDDALHFMLSPHPISNNANNLYPTKATLVVVPSAHEIRTILNADCNSRLTHLELMDVWKSEIKQYTTPCSYKSIPQHS